MPRTAAVAAARVNREEPAAVITTNPDALKPPIVTTRLTVIGPVDDGDLVTFIWQADKEAGGSASFGVPVGGMMPARPGEPAGYGAVDFSTGSIPAAAAWDRHASFVRAAGAWLDARDVPWAWQFEADPWLHGTVPAARGGAA
jgi:hypothetical protein